MKYVIGSKSIFWIFILFVSLCLIYFSKLGHVANLLQVEPSAALVVGVVASLLGSIFYRVGRPFMASPYVLIMRFKGLPEVYEITLIHFNKFWLTFDKNVGIKAIELPHSLQKIIIFLSFATLGLLVFSQREVSLIEQFPKNMSWGVSKTCEDAKRDKTPAKERPECQLILRGYELGYVDDLGDCGEFADEEPKWCDLRQKDEPYLHFAWRRLNGFTKTSIEYIAGLTTKNLEKKYNRDVKRIKPMSHLKLSEISGAPRAQHFVIMNLPEPKGWFWKNLKNKLFPSQCVETESSYPNKLPEPKSEVELSGNLVSAFGHLLFDNRYNRVIGSCKEYELIWGQKNDICKTIRKNPAKELKKLGLNSKINKIIERYNNKIKSYPENKTLTPKEVVSVNCLEFGSKKTQQKVYPFKIKDQNIWLKVLNYSKIDFKVGSSVESFQIASQLTSLRFHYGRFLSKASWSMDKEVSVTEELMNPDDFKMTRLVYLEDVDVFLSSHWILGREDLLEVYPYYLHLAHFVNSFRDNYASSRGRL